MTAADRPAPRAALAAIGALSLLACAFLLWLLYGREASGGSSEALSFLPALNAGFNAASSACLVAGFVAIRRRRIDAHRTAMLSAFAFSTLFLVGYVIHHALHGDTRYPGEGWLRGVYLSVLASHVVLSVVALPMVLTTFFLSLTGRFERHRRLARFTLPIWLYVSVTGVVVFLMLRAAGAGLPATS